MKLAFQIILAIVLTVTFFGSIGEDDRDLRRNMTAVCIASMLSEVATFLIL